LKRDEGPSEGGKYGPYLQSQRKHFYNDAVNQLIEEGHAYRCFCSTEVIELDSNGLIQEFQRLDIIRRNAHVNKINPRYDNRCRSISDEESNARKSEPHTVRFKFDPGLVHFHDSTYGSIDNEVDEGDFILLKSDGFPTYHLANVVDDRLMKISHVIRGQEWLASTPKHVRLYE
jgi:glutamyl-tRNA synthetase